MWQTAQGVNLPPLTENIDLFAYGRYGWWAEVPYSTHLNWYMFVFWSLILVGLILLRKMTHLARSRKWYHVFSTTIHLYRILRAYVYVQSMILGVHLSPLVAESPPIQCIIIVSSSSLCRSHKNDPHPNGWSWKYHHFPYLEVIVIVIFPMWGFPQMGGTPKTSSIF